MQLNQSSKSKCAPRDRARNLIKRIRIISYLLPHSGALLSTDLNSRRRLCPYLGTRPHPSPRQLQAHYERSQVCEVCGNFGSTPTSFKFTRREVVFLNAVSANIKLGMFVCLVIYFIICVLLSYIYCLLFIYSFIYCLLFIYLFIYLFIILTRLMAVVLDWNWL